MISGKLVSVVYYKLNLLENINDSNLEVYKTLELSSAIKCPNVFSFLATLKPIRKLLLRTNMISKIFNELELVNEVTRFIPQSVLFSDVEEEQNQPLRESIKQNPENWEVLNLPECYKLGSVVYISAEDALKEIESDKSAEERYLFVEKLVLATHKSTILREEQIINSTFTSKTSIYGASLISRKQNQVIKNKIIGILSKLYDTESNSTRNTDYCINIPLLRKDIDLKTISEIKYI